MIIVGCVVTSSKLLLDSFLAEAPVTPVIMSGGRGSTTSDQGFMKQNKKLFLKAKLYYNLRLKNLIRES